MTLSRGCGGPLTLCSARRGQILSTDNISPLGGFIFARGRITAVAFKDKELNVNDCLRGCSQETWEDIKGYQV